MKSRSTEASHLSSSEAGIIIPFLAMAIITIFCLLGLAIDGGRIYAAQLEAQIAADASSFAAAANLATTNVTFNDVSSGILTTQAQDALGTGESIAFQNTRFHGSDWAAATVNIGLTTDNGTMEVTSEVTHDVPLIFIRVLPGIGTFRRVTARARAEITPALGAVALDSSGSMNCPIATTPLGEAEAANCDCFPTCGDDAQRRFGAVLNVVRRAFLNKFDPDRDQVSILMYDKTVQELVSIDPNGGYQIRVGVNEGTGDFELGAGESTGYTDAVVREFDVTNVTLAIIRSYELVNPFFQANPERVPFIALLSDGAPTGTCIIPTDVKSTAAAHLPGLVACFWEVIWEGFFDPAAKDPKPLAKPGISAIGRATTYAQVPNHAPMHPPFNKAPCSTLTFPVWGGPENPGEPEDAKTEIENCLDSYNFIDINGGVHSGGPINAVVFEGDPSTPADDKKSGVSQWRQVFYRSALAQADAIRSRGYVFYTIGLGLPSSNDLYNGLDNPLGMKSFFLGRIALPYAKPPQMVGEFPGHPSWQGLVATFNTANEHTKGEFYPVLNATDGALEQQFRQLVRRVKLRMVRSVSGGNSAFN